MHPLLRRIIAPLGLLFFSLLFLPSWIFQFMLVTSLIITLMSFLYSRMMIRVLYLEREQAVIKVDAFQSITVRMTIRNISSLPVTNIMIEDSSRNLFFIDFPRELLTLPAHSSIALQHSLKGYRRGIYEIGPVVVTGSDPLGLFPWKLQQKNTKVQVIIYPETIPTGRLLYSGVPGGPEKIIGRIFEDLNRYRGIRDYIPGDPLQHINWKASAKTASLQTMEYENTRLVPAIILLDLRESAFPLRHRSGWLERAVTVAASLTIRHISDGQPVGFFSNGIPGHGKDKANGDEVESVSRSGNGDQKVDSVLFLPPIAGHTQADEILTLLAVISFTGSEQDILGRFLEKVLSSGLPVSRGMQIVCISPLPQPPAKPILQLLRNRGIELTWLYPQGVSGKEPDNPATRNNQLLPRDLLQLGISSRQIIEFGPELYRTVPAAAAGRDTGTAVSEDRL